MIRTLLLVSLGGCISVLIQVFLLISETWGRTKNKK